MKILSKHDNFFYMFVFSSHIYNYVQIQLVWKEECDNFIYIWYKKSFYFYNITKSFFNISVIKTEKNY